MNSPKYKKHIQELHDKGFHPRDWDHMQNTGEIRCRVCHTQVCDTQHPNIMQMGCLLRKDHEGPHKATSGATWEQR